MSEIKKEGVNERESAREKEREGKSDVGQLYGDGAARLNGFVDINGGHFHLLIVMVLNCFR